MSRNLQALHRSEKDESSLRVRPPHCQGDTPAPFPSALLRPHTRSSRGTETLGPSDEKGITEEKDCPYYGKIETLRARGMS